MEGKCEPECGGSQGSLSLISPFFLINRISKDVCGAGFIPFLMVSVARVVVPGLDGPL